MPSLRVDDSEAAKASAASRGKVKDSAASASSSASSSVAKTGGSSSLSTGSAQPSSSSSAAPTSGSHVGRTMSHISGVKRPLSHSNSVTTSEKVAKYGVDTPNEHELGKVYQ